MDIIKFSAAWCGPCKKMKPVVDKIADEHAVQVAEVDIDSESGRALASLWNVSGVPTIIRVDKDGNEVARLVGAHPKSKVEKALGIV